MSRSISGCAKWGWHIPFCAHRRCCLRAHTLSHSAQCCLRIVFNTAYLADHLAKNLSPQLVVYGLQKEAALNSNSSVSLYYVVLEKSLPTFWASVSSSVAWDGLHNTTKLVLLLSHFKDEKNWGTESVSSFPKITKWKEGEPEFKAKSLFLEPILVTAKVWLVLGWSNAL